MSDTPSARPLVILGAFLRRAVVEGASYRAAQVLRATGFFIALASLAFMARLIDAAPNPHLAPYGGYGAFALLGLVAADLQRAAASGLSLRLREAQLQGTLEALLATPAPTGLVILGAVLPDLAAALGRTALVLVLAALVFGVDLGRADPLGALTIGLAALAAFGALGLVGAAATLALRRGDPFGALLGGLSLVAGGVFYPRTVLPTWLRLLGDLLPMTPATEGLRRAVLVGDGLGALVPELARLGIFTALVGPLGVLALAAALRRARRDGSLTFY